MIPSGKFQCQLIPHLMRLLRCDLSRSKGLQQKIGQHIPFLWLTSSGQVCIEFLTDRKFLRGSFGRTLVGGNQSSPVCFIRIFTVLDSVAKYCWILFPSLIFLGFNFEIAILSTSKIKLISPISPSVFRSVSRQQDIPVGHPLHLLHKDFWFH